MHDLAIDLRSLVIWVKTIPSITSGTLRERAIASFAVAYADQNERDYHQLVEAVAAGQIKAVKE